MNINFLLLIIEIPLIILSIVLLFFTKSIYSLIPIILGFVIAIGFAIYIVVASKIKEKKENNK